MDFPQTISMLALTLQSHYEIGVALLNQGRRRIEGNHAADSVKASIFVQFLAERCDLFVPVGRPEPSCRAGSQHRVTGQARSQRLALRPN
jgi:hypothetical protein